MKFTRQTKMRRTRLFFIFILALSTGWTAAQKHSSPQKASLENGMTLIYERDTSSKITAVQIYVKGGKRVEQPEKSGLAYLTTRLTLEFPDQDKLRNIMDQATQIGFDLQSDYSYVAILSLSDKLEASLKIISQIMHKPLFSGLRINGAKKLMERMRDRRGDEPINLSHQKFMETIFAGTPYGHPSQGTKETLKATKKKDIENYFKRLYNGGNMVAVVSSDLEFDAVQKLMNEYYGKFPEGESQTLPSLEVPSPTSQSHNIERDSQQTLVSAGFLLPEISHKNYVLASLLENLLGKGIGSRLWALRAQENLAYNVNARLTYCQAGGLIEAYLETENKNQATALTALKDILTDLQSQGISPEELEITKTYFKSTFLQDIETKERRSQNLGYFEIIGLGYDFMQNLMTEVDNVTLDEINNFIQEVLDPEKSCYVVVGPEI